MDNFKRILVGADLSSMDNYLLETLKFMSELYNPEKAYVLHVSPDLEIPEFAQEIYDNIKRIPLDEQFEEALQESVNHHIPNTIFPIEINVIEGELTEQLLHWTKIKGIDLTVVGRKEPHAGTGLGVKRLLRRSSSSVLFVPPKSLKHIRKILVPSDYSTHAIHALKEAINLANTLPEIPEIAHFYVYNVPSEIHVKMMRSYSEFEKMMRDQVEDFYKKFIEKIDTEGINIQPVFIQNEYSNPARHIKAYAEENDVDLVIMGAQGHSALESVLLGSVSEKFLSIQHQIATLVLRLGEGE